MVLLPDNHQFLERAARAVRASGLMREPTLDHASCALVEETLSIDLLNIWHASWRLKHPESDTFVNNRLGHGPRKSLIMATPMYSEGIPSERINLIRHLEGQKLTRLVRYSWLPEDVAIDEYGIKKNQIFSLTAGPLLMFFSSGLTVGFGSVPSKNSVILWVEKDEEGKTIENPIESDTELYPIDANEHSCWKSFLGKKVSAVKIIRQKPKSAKYTDLANEVGLTVIFEDGSEFIISHGLHDDSDDFSVIQKAQIDKSLISQLDV